ncbi:hypothetical protein BGX38DRAFT_1147612 [Terfezia claveryi]|nr:hypothetical protein BGX38DRAFT_1147612 [Terfezia claveryi]
MPTHCFKVTYLVGIYPFVYVHAFRFNSWVIPSPLPPPNYFLLIPKASTYWQNPESKGKKQRVAVDSGIDMPLAQVSLITKGSLQPVEELAAARSQAVIHKLADQIKALDVKWEQFADPKQCILLPFPYAGVVPKRFQLEGQEHVFRFCGRTAWKPIYEQVKAMNAMQNNRLHLHGTLGAGKSYLLAGLVCQLQREGMRVIYLPDCYELLLCEPPALYILPSLYLAFYQDPVLGDKVKELTRFFFEKGRTQEDLEWDMIMFCNLAAQVERPIIWVIDQANALDDGEYDRVNNVKKTQTRRFLDRLSSKHMKLASSTANCSAAKHDEIMATSESRFNLYLGLDDIEMTEWWRRLDITYGHLQQLQFEPTQKESLERLTGRMPLLLRGLEHVLADKDLGQQVAIGGIPRLSNARPSPATMGAQLLPTVHARLMELPEVMKLVGAINRYASAKFEEFSDSGNDDARKRFQRGWEACIFETPLAETECSHLDGRFFFRERAEDGVYVGRTTCDLARTVGATRLRQLQNLGDFGEKPWVNRIAHAGGNPAVLGFLVERAVLGILITSGTKFAGPELEFHKALDLQKFSGYLPNDAPKRNNKAIIYVPTRTTTRR